MARFESLVIPVTETGCWLWAGAAVTNSTGGEYGRFSYQGSLWLAHRFAVVLYQGIELRPPGKHPLYTRVVDHACRVTLCVCPWHLRVMSQSMNTRVSYMVKDWYARRYPQGDY